MPGLCLCGRETGSACPGKFAPTLRLVSPGKRRKAGSGGQTEL